MSEQTYPKIGSLKDVAAFRARVSDLRLNLPCDEHVLSTQNGSPMAQPIDVDGFRIGNRWCIHAMEGWDGTTTGEPSEHTIRRWEHFGASGAKLIWGGEAFAVQGDARANPLQLGIVDDNVDRAAKGARKLLQTLLTSHRSAAGPTDDLLVGLQLTHSGRYCKPYDKKKFEPWIAYHHPILDARVGIKPDDDSRVISDDSLKRLTDNFIRAAKLAQRVGFQFVDVKACHGYLGHELLSAFTRPGPYGGSLENRTRFAREIIQGIQAACPGLKIGLRLSAFDQPPFQPGSRGAVPGKLGIGIPSDYSKLLPYWYGFGCDPNDPLKMNLAEPIQFIHVLRQLGVKLINVSCGSPYYNPHIQRPAIFPPSDGYQPPEDPLAGVARQIDAVRQIKSACPDSVIVGTGYTYLQEYLPHVAQAVVREGWTDLVGLGRMVLSYWDLPLNTLSGHSFQTKRICRTFSDCTTAPRNGIISGCYPLDDHYKSAPEHAELKQKKEEMRKSLTVIQK